MKNVSGRGGGKPNVKLLSYTVENDGAPFVFRISPEMFASAEVYSADDAHDRVNIDDAGNIHLGFDHEPTLVMGAGQGVKGASEGFWINDVKDVTVSPDGVTGDGEYGIKLLSGETTFHVVMIVEDALVTETVDDVIDPETGEFLDGIEYVDEDELAAMDDEIGSAEEWLNERDEVAEQFNREFDDFFAVRKPSERGAGLPERFDGRDRFYHANALSQSGEMDALLDLAFAIVDQEQREIAERGELISDEELIARLSAMPGLGLTLGRPSASRQVMRAAMKRLEVMREGGRVDETVVRLWVEFVRDIAPFLEATGDRVFVERKLMPVADEVFSWFESQGVVNPSGLVDFDGVGIQAEWVLGLGAYVGVVQGLGGDGPGKLLKAGRKNIAKVITDDVELEAGVVFELVSEGVLDGAIASEVVERLVLEARTQYGFRDKLVRIEDQTGGISPVGLAHGMGEYIEWLLGDDAEHEVRGVVLVDVVKPIADYVALMGGEQIVAQLDASERRVLAADVGELLHVLVEEVYDRKRI